MATRECAASLPVVPPSVLASLSFSRCWEAFPSEEVDELSKQLCPPESRQPLDGLSVEHICLNDQRRHDLSACLLGDGDSHLGRRHVGFGRTREHREPDDKGRADLETTPDRDLAAK